MTEAQLVLASASPRRRELLAQIGVQFTVMVADIDETPWLNELADTYVARMALEKAQAVRRRLSVAQPVLAADTSVVIDGDILGKPENRGDALSMLARLSGRTHQVYTALTLIDFKGQEHQRLSVSQVTFRGLSEAERVAYWGTGEPTDKAGAYAIQGRAAVFVARLEGSFSGVMGLPLYETAQLLDDVK